MAALEADSLLGPDDPAPFEVYNAGGASPFLLLGDHAGTAIPASLKSLGLGPEDRGRHIALDIGVEGLGQVLARELDCPFLRQIYSRLVIDCNRHSERADAVPEISDRTYIPGNMNLPDSVRRARIESIHVPYHAAISRMLDDRQHQGRATVLVSLHSFTPILNGSARPWDVGILYWRGRTDFALGLRDAVARQTGIVVGDNVPYAMDDTDYTVPYHAFSRALPYVEIEVKQSLIDDPQGQAVWAARLGTAAREALDRIAL